jgi:hypothetical protein
MRPLAMPREGYEAKDEGGDSYRGQSVRSHAVSLSPPRLQSLRLFRLPPRGGMQSLRVGDASPQQQKNNMKPTGTKELETERLVIYLGRDGDPNGKPASVWIVLENGTLHIEVEDNMEAMSDLDIANTQKFFKTLGIDDKNAARIEEILKKHFMQSPELKNFGVLEKFRSICDANNIQYKTNSWISGYDMEYR